MLQFETKYLTIKKYSMECITRTTGNKPNIATYSQIETSGHMYHEYYKYETRCRRMQFWPNALASQIENSTF